MNPVAITGYQDSGKTTLLERLVRRLSERGRVATVKSIHHDVEIDTPGKDTHRHREAGADTVVGVTPSLTYRISVENGDDRDPDDSLDRGLDRLDDEYDYVLVEGFKSVDVPKILVGDIEESAVEGPILTRVTEAREADVGQLIDIIDESVADR